MNISLYALMTAIKSVHRDIAHHEKLASDASLNDEDLDYYGQQVLDLTKVFGELCMAYQAAQKADLEFPLLEDLIRTI